MSPPLPRPCGTWPSVITSALIVSRTIQLGGVRPAGDDVWWVEGRPEEAGRHVLVRRGPDAAPVDVVAAPFDVRSRVHEYGGAAYALHAGSVWFSDFGSGRLHRVDPGGAPRPITPEGDVRFADIVVDALRGRLICVVEDHTTGAPEAVNAIAAVPWDGGAPEVIAGGHDFAAAPRLSPDGGRLAWLTWDHPQLPWDGTELWVADLDDEGRPVEAVLVAGGDRESILDPAWGPDGSLWFSSDRDGGWWNLHRWDGTAVRNVAPMEAETASPPWQLGAQRFALLADGAAAVIVTGGGRDRLFLIDPESGTRRELEVPFSEFGGQLAARGESVVTVAASPTIQPCAVVIDTRSAAVEVLRRSSDIEVDPDLVSVAEPIAFPSTGGRTAHAQHYAPRNPRFRVPDGERPPLLVMVHGGPTGSASAALRWGIQYFTSRGFAVVDVDYGGSSGYGRAYRECLYGQWGVVDLDDCLSAVRHLVERGDADPARVCIDGGSAGGYTTLRALTASDAFAAGCSLFGIGDLSTFVHDTHKFESRYLDHLVGPFPELADVYADRSPVNHVDRLRTPVILFQGLDDRIVPPNQSQLFYDAALGKGIPCAYEAFAGEQHGFRIAANIRRCLDGELAFYGAVLGFVPADILDPPLRIANLCPAD